MKTTEKYLILKEKEISGREYATIQDLLYTLYTVNRNTLNTLALRYDVSLSTMQRLLKENKIYKNREFLG